MEAQIWQVLSHLAEGVILLDRDLTVRYVNPSALNMFGIISAEACGLDLWTVLPQVRESLQRDQLQGSIEKEDNNPIVFATQHGQRSFSGFVWPSTNGFSVHLTDITAQARSSELFEVLRGLYLRLVGWLGPLQRPFELRQILELDSSLDSSPEAKQRLHELERSVNKGLRMTMADCARTYRLFRPGTQPEPVDLSQIAREVWITNPVLSLQCMEPIPAVGDLPMLSLTLRSLFQHALLSSKEPRSLRIGRGKDGSFFVSDEGQDFATVRILWTYDSPRRETDGELRSDFYTQVARLAIERQGGRLWAEMQPEGGVVYRFTLG